MTTVLPSPNKPNPKAIGALLEYTLELLMAKENDGKTFDPTHELHPAKAGANESGAGRQSVHCQPAQRDTALLAPETEGEARQEQMGVRAGPVHDKE
jgi:hypothetical protein